MSETLLRNKAFFDYLIEHADLDCNYLSLDLLPHMQNDYRAQLPDLLQFKDIIAFKDCGYEFELREVRYFTILVAEYTKVKRDIKLYQLLS